MGQRFVSVLLSQLLNALTQVWFSSTDATSGATGTSGRSRRFIFRKPSGTEETTTQSSSLRKLKESFLIEFTRLGTLQGESLKRGQLIGRVIHFSFLENVNSAGRSRNRIFSNSDFGRESGRVATAELNNNKKNKFRIFLVFVPFFIAQIES